MYQESLRSYLDARKPQVLKENAKRMDVTSGILMAVQILFLFLFFILFLSFFYFKSDAHLWKVRLQNPQEGGVEHALARTRGPRVRARAEIASFEGGP